MKEQKEGGDKYFRLKTEARHVCSSGVRQATVSLGREKKKFPAMSERLKETRGKEKGGLGRLRVCEEKEINIHFALAIGSY